MKGRIPALLLLGVLAASAPVLAQSRRLDIIGKVAWIGASEDLDLGRMDDFGAEFESKAGFGVGLDLYLGRSLSLELSGSYAKPEAVLSFTSGRQRPEKLEIYPVTASVRFHILPSSRFDPYVGAGAAYVIFGDEIASPGLLLEDVEKVEVDDEVGWLVNAGLNVDITRHFAINLDGKYIGVRPEFAVTFRRGDFTAMRQEDLNLFLLSAGIVVRF